MKEIKNKLNPRRVLKALANNITTCVMGEIKAWSVIRDDGDVGEPVGMYVIYSSATLRFYTTTAHNFIYGVKYQTTRVVAQGELFTGDMEGLIKSIEEIDNETLKEITKRLKNGEGEEC